MCTCYIHLKNYEYNTNDNVNCNFNNVIGTKKRSEKVKTKSQYNGNKMKSEVEIVTKLNIHLHNFYINKPSMECEFHAAITLSNPTSTTFNVIKEMQNCSNGSKRLISRPFSILTNTSFIG